MAKDRDELLEELQDVADKSSVALETTSGVADGLIDVIETLGEEIDELEQRIEELEDNGN